MFRRKPVVEVKLDPRLFCAADGCNLESSAEYAIPTGMLGIGRVRVYLCTTHQQERKQFLTRKHT